MKKNYILSSLLLTTAITMSACGDSDSENDYFGGGSETSDGFLATHYYVYLYPENGNENTVELKADKFSYKNGIGYADLPADEYENYVGVLEGEYVTEQNWYIPDPTRYADGYRFYEVINSSNNKGTIAPYNLNGHKDLQMTAEIKWINISGQKMLDYVDTYSASGDSNSKYAKIKSALESTVLPQGSACLMDISYKVNKDFLYIWAKLDNNYYYDLDLNGLSSLADIKVKFIENNKNFDEGMWANSNWIKDEDDTVFIEKNGAIYVADYVSPSDYNNIVSDCYDINETAYNAIKNTVSTVK